MRRFTVHPVVASETSGAAVRKRRRLNPDEANLIATDGTWEMWEPLTFEGSVKLAGKGGKKAVWDTAYEDGGYFYFDQYMKRGPLYIFINTANPEEKYQYHEATNSFFNQYDGYADLEAFMCEHPTFAEYLGIEC